MTTLAAIVIVLFVVGSVVFETWKKSIGSAYPSSKPFAVRLIVSAWEVSAIALALWVVLR